MFESYHPISKHNTGGWEQGQEQAMWTSCIRFCTH